MKLPKYNLSYNTRDLIHSLAKSTCERKYGFDKEKQEKLSEMGNFFCMLHPLLTFAEEANKALIHFENACL